MTPSMARAQMVQITNDPYHPKCVTQSSNPAGSCILRLPYEIKGYMQKCVQLKTILGVQSLWDSLLLQRHLLKMCFSA